MPTKLPKAAPSGRLIGYARVSTEEQGTDPQLDELRAAGRGSSGKARVTRRPAGTSRSEDLAMRPSATIP